MSNRPSPRSGSRRCSSIGSRAGLRVVRLKGGDPFVLGRGGEEIGAELLAGGRPAHTPAAVLTSGCTPQAGLLVTTLGRLGDDAAAARIVPPAVVVVGRVVDVLLGQGEPAAAMLGT